VTDAHGSAGAGSHCPIAQGRTSFVIAHRLSTVTQADQVLVIQQGKSAGPTVS